MKRFGTKFSALLLVLCMILSVLPISAFGEGVEDTTIENAKVKIWDVDSPYAFSFDFRSLTEGDNTDYSRSLSIFASLMAEDVSIQKGHQIVVDGRSGSFMEQMGFKNIEKIVLNSESYDHDNNDISVVYIGRRPMTVDDQEYVVYGVGIVDSYGNIQFWKSNVDIGAPGQEYTDVTGEHDPSWNTVHAKGFDVTANRVYDQVEDYLARYAAEDEGKTKSMLITGHSRGAAIANLVGKKYEDKKDGEVKPYTYTYASPYTTTVDEATAQSYETIFNIINANDLVANIPPTDVENWDFRRYGTDKIVDIDADDDLVEEWNRRIAPMIEGELKKTSSENGPRDITPENALLLLEKVYDAILDLKEKEPGRYDEVIAELEKREIRFSEKTENIEYVSACGAEVPEIIGELIPSRKGLYTKNVEITLSFEGIKTIEGFRQKLEALKLRSYCDITGAMDAEGNVPVTVCPDVFFESVFSAMGPQGLNMDYVKIIIQGILSEKRGDYPMAVIRALLYAPELINGLRPCHSAQTYYFLANKIPSDADEGREADPGINGEEIENKNVSAQNGKNVHTGIQHSDFVFYVEIGCIGVLLCIAVTMLIVRRKRRFE